MMTSQQPATTLSIGARKISSWELYVHQPLHYKVWDMACDYNDKTGMRLLYNVRCGDTAIGKLNYTGNYYLQHVA